MSRICIHHVSGSGGSFLTTMIAKLLDLKITNRIDNKHGDYHRSDKGIWKRGDANVCFMGNYWQNNNTAKIYYTHKHEFVKTLKTKYNDLKVIAIDADDDDFKYITTLFIKKGFPNLWTQQEYNKWVATGCNFPPYNISNLEHPDVFDIMHEQLNKDTIDWHNTLDRKNVNHIIKFKTIFGLNNVSLTNTLELLTDKPVTDSIKQMIIEYQLLNKKLYFSA
tara:strand:+ start:171 stop:833 length:663 start_codon:yes stop_codon:yes gene_type:complete